jgi:AcrR family transcriptional regulator
MPRRTAADVARSRAEAVVAAVDTASIDGLEGLTLGTLAERTGQSKSGLVGRFGDRAALQRATLDEAVRRFTGAVWEPACAAPPGRARLEALIDAWIAHLRDDVFPGGCFVTTASVEFDARPGELHDAVADVVRRWLAVLEAEARTAQAAGDLAGDRDPAAVAFELHALASGGGVASRLLGDRAGLERTHAAMRRAAGLAAAAAPRPSGAGAP